MEDLPEGKYGKLNYRLVESTSEDPEYPLFELLKGKIDNIKYRPAIQRLDLNSIL
jgi:hypothetical protein